MKGGTFGPPPDKKVPESKKYSHIASSIDTGATAKKQQIVSTSSAAKRRDEIFKRIRPATLVRLLQERDVNESVYALTGDGDASLANDGRSAATSLVIPAAKAPGAAPSRAVGSAISSAVGSVAGSVVSVIDTDTTVDEARDLVLLDLRDPEDFDRCRLPLAVSYPAQKINRDQFPPELHRCKRDPSKLLVVYHSNDQSTTGVAALLVQKGWDLVHALSGGFEEMVQSYPEVLEGEVPALAPSPSRSRPETGATSKSSLRASR
jgi:rhodanese-related sulfurtransferase